jgi:hypothetical protein
MDDVLDIVRVGRDLLTDCMGFRSKRRHECRRGTQECVRHNNFNTLRLLTKNESDIGHSCEHTQTISMQSPYE